MKSSAAALVIGASAALLVWILLGFVIDNDDRRKK